MQPININKMQPFNKSIFICLILMPLIIFCNGKSKSKEITNNSNNKDSVGQPIELKYKPVDKLNITTDQNYVINETHRIKLYKPTDWKVLTGTSQYTALKIAQTEYGAQVSINLKDPLNHEINDEFLNTEVEEFKTGLKDAGIELQNVIQQNINYGNYNARRIDGTWLKSVGNMEYVEKVTLITIIHDNKLITIGCTYPEQLLYLFSAELDRIINSLEIIKY